LDEAGNEGKEIKMGKVGKMDFFVPDNFLITHTYRGTTIRGGEGGGHIRPLLP
jgi:hypothetical protein